MKAQGTFHCFGHVARFGARVALVSAAVFALLLPALAGLGEDVSSIQADQAHLAGTLRSTALQAYTVHEIHAATGTYVREYVSTSGKVFGVAWQGPWLPDMRQLLASYFGQFQKGAQAEVNAHAGRRPLMISQPGLVVESGGHMRAFAGRAYAPDLLPQGVSPEVIR